MITSRSKAKGQQSAWKVYLYQYNKTSNFTSKTLVRLNDGYVPRIRAPCSSWPDEKARAHLDWMKSKNSIPARYKRQKLISAGCPPEVSWAHPPCCTQPLLLDVCRRFLLSRGRAPVKGGVRFEMLCTSLIWSLSLLLHQQIPFYLHCVLPISRQLGEGFPAKSKWDKSKRTKSTDQGLNLGPSNTNLV